MGRALDVGGSLAAAAHLTSAPLRRLIFVPAEQAYTRTDADYEKLGVLVLRPENSKQNTAVPKQPASEVMPVKKENLTPVKKEPDVKPLYDGPIHLQWPKVIKMGAGLNNLGNTCFLNSVVQCLTYTPTLAAYAAEGSHSRANCRVGGWCALCTVQTHIARALGSSGRAISPSALCQNLRQIARSFRIGRQEDAHEFARYLIEAMQEASLKSGRVKSGTPAADTTFVYQAFQGRLRSQVTCLSCKYQSNTYDPFLDLSLEISKAPSVDKALAHFTAIEVLDGQNKYQCSKCKSRVKAHKRFTVDKAPNVLMVQLKRFKFGMFGGKIDRMVEYDSSLDMSPYLSHKDPAQSRYQLYGVLVHSGKSTNSGHYYCYVKSPAGAWYEMDDSSVGPVSERKALSQRAYMLFYMRRPKDSPPKPLRPATAPPALSRAQAAPVTPSVKAKSTEAAPLSNGHALAKHGSSPKQSKSQSKPGQPLPMKPSPSPAPAASTLSRLDSPPSTMEPTPARRIAAADGAPADAARSRSRAGEGGDGQDGAASSRAQLTVRLPATQEDGAPARAHVRAASPDGNGKHRRHRRAGTMLLRSLALRSPFGMRQMCVSPKLVRLWENRKPRKPRRRSSRPMALQADCDATHMADHPLPTSSHTMSDGVSTSRARHDLPASTEPAAVPTHEKIRTKPIMASPASTKEWLKGSASKTLFGVQVARWEEGQEHAKTSDALIQAESRNTFKRRLDQWDEEYDLGRLKKMKKKPVEVDPQAGNPFQNASSSKQMMKVSHQYSNGFKGKRSGKTNKGT